MQFPIALIFLEVKRAGNPTSIKNCNLTNVILNVFFKLFFRISFTEAYKIITLGVLLIKLTEGAPSAAPSHYSSTEVSS